MDDILTYVIGGAVALGAIIAAGWLISKFWDNIREEVAAWLRKNNLQESSLMNVWIKFDNMVSTVKCKVFAKTQKTGEQQITERTLTPKEIEALQHKEPDVYAELQRHGIAQKNLMYMFQ